MNLLLLVAAIISADPRVPSNSDALSSLTPPASGRERALYGIIKDDAEDVRLFIATRKFVREPGKALSKDDFSFRFLVSREEEKKFRALPWALAVVDCAALEERDACKETQGYLRENFKPGADPKKAPPLPKGWQTKYASNADEMRFLIMANITQKLQAQ